MTLATISPADLPPQAYAHAPDHNLALTRDPVNFREITLTRWVKPHGEGLWTSTVTEWGTDGAPASSAWTEFQQLQFDRDEAAELLAAIDPMPDARILLIDSLEHLRALVEAYPAPPASGGCIHPRYPDWLALAAAGWDAVHLTDEGRRETHRPPGTVNLYSWDVECVLWLRHAYTVAVTGSEPEKENQ